MNECVNVKTERDTIGIGTDKESIVQEIGNQYNSQTAYTAWGTNNKDYGRMHERIVGGRGRGA